MLVIPDSPSGGTKGYTDPSSSFLALATDSAPGQAASGGPRMLAGQMTTSFQRSCWAAMAQASHSESVLAL